MVTRKKQTKQSILKAKYDKAYTNYLARVRNLEKQGVLVKRIKRVKNPKLESINRLEKQTGKVIYEKSRVVEYSTGNIIEANELGRKKARESNRVWLKLDVFQQDYARMNNITSASELKMLKTVGVKTQSVVPTEDYNMIIEHWYESINDFIDSVAEYLKVKTDALLATASERERAEFAYTIKKYPDILPEPPYENKERIDAIMLQMLNKMHLVENTQEFSDFLENQNIVEDE